MDKIALLDSDFMDTESQTIPTMPVSKYLDLLKEHVVMLQNSGNEVQSMEADVKIIRERIKNLPRMNQKESKTLLGIGVQLFNLGVQMSNDTKQEHLELNAQIRQCACDCIAFALTYVGENPEILLTAVSFFSRTGKLWLDLEKYPIALNCLTTASEYYEKLKYLQPVSEEEAETRAKTLFFIHCWKGKTLWELNQYDAAYSEMTGARTLLDQLPEEISYLAMAYYELGAICAKVFDSVNAVKWLEGSAEILPQCQNYDKEIQARTLRFLAREYMTLQHYEKVLQVLSVANEEFPHPVGLFLLAKLYMIKGNQELAEENLHKSLRDAESLDLSLTICRSCIENNWYLRLFATNTKYTSYELALRAFKLVSDKFSQSPDLGKIKLVTLEAMLEKGDFQNAKAFAQETISEHFRGIHQLQTEVAKQLCHLLWNRAVTLFQSKEYSECAMWFKFTERLTNPEDTVNKAKILRFVSRCHFLTRDLDKAEETVIESLRFDSETSQGHLLHAKILISKGNSSQAIDALEKLCSAKDYVTGSLESCAKDAYEHRLNRVVIKALGHLVRMDRKFQVDGQLGSAFRILLKSLQEEFKDQSENDAEIAAIISFLKQAVDKLHNVGLQEMYNGNPDEVKWLLSYSWNLGTLCVKNHHLENAALFFKSAYEIATYLPENMSNLELQKLSVLQSTAAIVDQSMNNDAIPIETIRMALKEIEKCKQICKQQKNLLGEAVHDVDITTDKSFPLLYVLEFKCKAMLQDPNLLGFLKRAPISAIQSDLFEMMATIALNPKYKNFKVAVEAMRIALEKYRDAIPPTFDKIADIYRRMIRMTDPKDEQLPYYQEIIKLLEEIDVGLYPLVEMQWLVVSAWNHGVFYFRLLNYQRAEKWMSISLQLLNFYPQKEDYETEMMRGYSSVLTKVKQANPTTNI